MELILIGLIVIGMIAVWVYVKKLKGESDAEKRETEEARKRASEVERIIDDETWEHLKRPPSAPPTRSVRGDIRPKPTAPKVRSFRDERPVASVPNTTHSDSGISATDVLLAALVVDALTPDPVPQTKCEPTFEPGGGSFGGGGASSSWDSSPSSDYSSRDTSDYSGSSSSSYDSGSSSSSDSSSSSSSDW